MRCSKCGDEILLGEDSLVTTYDDQRRRTFQAPPIRQVEFCAQCAQRRRKLWLWFMWMPIILVLGLLLIGLL